ncbi:MAG: metal-dependent hydrolase [candidate division NC10 bacterium]|nr:metal-dependent hydrolase [candidate division NC10 bacterium]
MDPLSHITSTALAASVFVREEREKRPLIGAAVVSGLAPDLDVLSLFWGPAYYVRYHQTVTHNLFVVPVLIFLVAYLFHRFSRYHNFPVLLGFAALGAFWHLLLDLTITWGLAPFWPLSSRTYCLKLILLTDPLFLLLCAGACYAIFRLPYWHLRRKLAAIILPTLLVYFLARFFLASPR